MGRTEDTRCCETFEGCPISVLFWILIGGVAWLVVAAVVAVLIGRMIRARDRQVPRADDGAPPVPSADPLESAPGRHGRPGPAPSVIDEPRRRGQG